MIIFICDSRDYHAMDWYHVVKEICSYSGHVVCVATDIVEEGEDVVLLKENDILIRLWNINNMLLKKQSGFADIWRNLIKLVTLPLQILHLTKLKKKYPNAIFHAHSMYYIILSWLSNLKFIATPMGSDVLVRPDESRIYRLLTIKALNAANQITVDSIKMQKKIMELCKRGSIIIQNGIDVRMITSFISDEKKRNEIVSIRGLYPNYQIEKILNAREDSEKKLSITFVYPFYESGYRNRILSRLNLGDNDLGRLSKEKLYSLLATTLLVISIPDSDSSPRSVYESIFAGCCLAVSYSPWIDSLPTCMRSRIFVVELADPLWLNKALFAAKQITKIKYIPSKEALLEYDQYESMKKVCKEVYKIIT